MRNQVFFVTKLCPSIISRVKLEPRSYPMSRSISGGFSSIRDNANKRTDSHIYLSLHPYDKIRLYTISWSPECNIQSKFYTSSSLKFLPESFLNNDSDHTSCSTELNPGKVAHIYKDQRSAHKRIVKELRKQYKAEVEVQMRVGESEEFKRQATIRRAKLERQRYKNVRSVQSAVFQEEKRVTRLKQFERELDEAQRNRQLRRVQLKKARRLVLEELEKEAPMWITTSNEVDITMDNPVVVQELWARPGGYVGAPNPIDCDSEFWRYESHTWDMTRTYPSPRHLLLEDLEEVTYIDSNLDYRYWTYDRLKEQEAIEEKAKLRSMVREAGRTSLLLKQRDMIRDHRISDNVSMGCIRENGKPQLPCSIPSPSLGVLADYDGMELEGSKLLEADPKMFFQFEHNGQIKEIITNNSIEQYKNGNQDDISSSQIRLRKTLRDKSSMLTPYPLLVGRMVNYNTRSEKEKKREAREERMWAAAQAQASSGVEYFAEDDIGGLGESINYDEVGNISDDEDIEWEKGLDPANDDDLYNIPREMRYTGDDINWVIRCLNQKMVTLQEIVKLEEESSRQILSSTKRETTDNVFENIPVEISCTKFRTEENDDFCFLKELDKPVIREKGIDSKGRTFSQYNIMNGYGKSLDFDIYMDLVNILGSNDDGVINMKIIQSLMKNLSNEQISALEALEFEDITSERIKIKESLSNVPGLSDNQIQSLVAFEISLVNKKKSSINPGGSNKEEF